MHSQWRLLHHPGQPRQVKISYYLRGRNLGTLWESGLPAGHLVTSRDCVVAAVQTLDGAACFSCRSRHLTLHNCSVQTLDGAPSILDSIH